MSIKLSEEERDVRVKLDRDVDFDHWIDINAEDPETFIVVKDDSMPTYNEAKYWYDLEENGLEFVQGFESNSGTGKFSQTTPSSELDGEIRDAIRDHYDLEALQGNDEIDNEIDGMSDEEYRKRGLEYVPDDDLEGVRAEALRQLIREGAREEIVEKASSDGFDVPVVPRVTRAGALNTAVKVVEQADESFASTDEVLAEVERLADNIVLDIEQNSEEGRAKIQAQENHGSGSDGS